jgi:hypothetical protein
MSDDDIHKMMDRAHIAETREARLRIEVDRLKAERDEARGASFVAFNERDEARDLYAASSDNAAMYLAENERLSEVAAAEMKLREGNFDIITQLEAENERLRRDAERYRWICRFPEDADYAITHALNGCDGTGDGPSFRDLLSDVIDAALSAVPSDSPADVKTAPQMDLTKPVPTKAG